MRWGTSWAVCGLLLLAACGDDGGGAGGASAGTGGAGGAPNADLEDFEAGGDRPVTVRVPSGYDGSPTPLVILLHGYGATGALQDILFDLEPATDTLGMIFAAPDGTPDAQGRRFWNAYACCNFLDEAVDDVAYLNGLIDEISATANVDPKRVYFVGHSNGGFMSHRMACDAADRVAAIVSLAGAFATDPAECAPSEPVSVVQIHGTVDDTILYEGGDLFGRAYPSAATTVAEWSERDGCTGSLAEVGAPLDIDFGLDGAETRREGYSCPAGLDVQLWTIEGGGHIPQIVAPFADEVLGFLLAHPKP